MFYIFIVQYSHNWISVECCIMFLFIQSNMYLNREGPLRANSPFLLFFTIPLNKIQHINIQYVYMAHIQYKKPHSKQSKKIHTHISISPSQSKGSYRLKWSDLSLSLYFVTRKSPSQTHHQSDTLMESGGTLWFPAQRWYHMR